MVHNHKILSFIDTVSDISSIVWPIVNCDMFFISDIFINLNKLPHFRGFYILFNCFSLTMIHIHTIASALCNTAGHDFDTTNYS